LPNIPVIMISGHANIETAVKTIKIGAYDFIEKPFQADKLIHMVNRAIESQSLLVENTVLKNNVIEKVLDNRRI
jgi:two-component system nitrogen regulation response regulator NtrX